MFDHRLFSGGGKTHAGDLFVRISLPAANVYNAVGIHKVGCDIIRKVRGVNNVGADGGIAQKNNFSLFDHGTEYLHDIIEIPGGPVNDVGKAALFQLLLHQVLGVKHGHLRGLIRFEHGDIDELFHAGCLRFPQQVHVALIVDLIVVQRGGGLGKAYSGYEHIRSLAQSFQGSGISHIDLSERKAARQTQIPFHHVCSYYFMAFPQKRAENVAA